MNAAVDSLQAIYGNLIGKPYPREMPMPAREMADVLNNKALSYIELDAEKYSERAEALWREALTLDAHHPETTYNISVREWRAALIPVDEVVRRMEEVRTTHANGWRNEYLLGMVYLESGDGEKAVQSLEEAVQKSGSVPEVVSALEQARKLPGVTCVRVFSGHTGRVSCICLSTDARWAVSGGKGVNKGFDKTLRLWEVDTGKCIRVFEGHTSGINSVCISVNGQWAISGGEDKMLRLWELATGQCLRVFEGHTGRINSLCLSEDGRWALSGSYDNTLRLWDVTTGACVRVLKGNEFYWNVTSVCLSADGRWAVSGGNGYNKPLWLWDLAIGQCINVFGEFSCEVDSVCLSTDEHWVLSGGRAELRLWDLASGECLRVFEGHTSGVCSVCLSEDGRWALSGSYDKTLRLWEVSTGRCLRVFEGHAELVSSVCLSKDSRWALSGSWDGTLRLWNIHLANRTYRIVQPYALSFAVTAEETTENERKFRNAIKSAEDTLAIGRFKEALTYALEARAIHGHARTPESMTLWHRIGRCMRREGFRGGWHMRTFKGDRQGVNSVCMSADGRLILSSSDYSIYLWDVTTGDCLRSLTGNRELVKSVYLSPNGRWALSGSDGYNNTLCLWDLSTNESEPLFQGHNEPVCSVCLSADGRWALSISGDDRQGRTLRLWETTSGRCLRIFDYPWDERNTVCLSVDGLLALSTSDYNIHLWNVTTGDCIRSLTGNSELVNSICLSTDGRWALSASENMKLWNVVSGECVRVFESGWVNRICLSGDGRWALSASGFEDQLLRLWNVATGECVRVFKGHTGGVNSLCLSADGRWALSGSYDNTLRLWELDWDYEAMDPADWDESARPYLENFLTLHTPYAASLPDGEPSEAEIIRALTREGTPVYTDDDFNQLLETFANAGYGWLRPEGVRRELEKMTMNWTGPPPIA